VAIGPTPPAGVTLPIRRAWADVYAHFGQVVNNAGTRSCRRIFGQSTGPWSEHAWGNAWDITGTTAVLDRVARFLNGKPYAAQVLWQGRNLVDGHAVEDHYDHVHLSGAPLQNPDGTSVPPCAGGPQIHHVGTVQQPNEIKLPAPAATVGGESWAPSARISARELAQSAGRIERAASGIRAILHRR
jgi:hypothetical protein